jgi:hypothetical protein
VGATYIDDSCKDRCKDSVTYIDDSCKDSATYIDDCCKESATYIDDSCRCKVIDDALLTIVDSCRCCGVGATYTDESCEKFKIEKR